MNICVLMPYSYIFHAGFTRSFWVEVVARYLRSSGHGVTWVLHTPEDIRPELFGDTRAIAVPEPRRRWPLPLRAFLPPLLARRKWAVVDRLLRGEKWDVILVGDDVMDGVLALRARRKYGIPFVFKRDEIIAPEWFSPSKYYGFAYPLLRTGAYLGDRLAWYLFQKSDRAIVVSSALRDRLVERGIAGEKIAAIPRGANVEQFSPERVDPQIAAKYSLAHPRPTIVYVGATARLRRLDIILRALTLVKKEVADVRLALVGSGDKGYLPRLAADLGLKDDVVFTGAVPYPELPFLLTAADIAVCPVPPLEIYRLSSPTKLFEYLAAGLAVVANQEIPEHCTAIGGSGGGILVPYQDAAFAGAMIQLLMHPDLRKEMGRRGREWIVRHRSYEDTARHLETTLYQAAGEGKGQP